MNVLEEVKKKIAYLTTCSSAYLLAHAAWSACDHRCLPGPSVLDISADLDSECQKYIFNLQQITSFPDYSNSDQAEMLRWLHKNGYSSYVAKKVKTTKNKLVDWE